MVEVKKERRPRRSYTEEFKAGAVRLVLEEGKTVSQVARDLDLTLSALRTWVEQARADSGKGKPGALTSAERQELTKLRKQVRELEMERTLLKKLGGLHREGERVKFEFIRAEQAHFSISLLCRLLQVSRSGFYAWRRRPPSPRHSADERLKVLVREAHEQGRRTYGSPRVHRALRTQGVRISRKRVIRLMQAEHLVGRARRRYRCTTVSEPGLPVAANLLQRRFTADGPNQRWVGDTTELTTPEGKLYLAAIIDLYSRFVVGWALSAMNDRHLTLKALDMALRRRRPEEGLLHHSDQGCTYASEDYQRVLEQHGLRCSMSRRGNCYDNAAMESWFSTLKNELGESFQSASDAKVKLFDYIEVFYNQQRMHSAIGYAAPAEFERAAA
ncbi:IS3 family transposase [Corallococcus terminator]|uniref:IS3 family transposase n=1 Tax=Corallococcus terminator TaxID=2316733 RepID=A0A3A8H5N8_9BACT|nr:IS3 family transposase [Corallococcus terminator]RKG66098.1 IS3 family transposase [Corallococcus terminator]